MIIHYSQSQVWGWLDDWSLESGPPYDPFHLAFIHEALQDALWMKHAVFGLGHYDCSLLPDSPEHNDPIGELFTKYGVLVQVFIK